MQYIGEDFSQSKRIRITDGCGCGISSALACRALNIVLQQTMNPVIGWHCNSLQENSVKLQREIIEHNNRQFNELNGNVLQRFVKDETDKLLTSPFSTFQINGGSWKLEIEILLEATIEAHLPRPLSVSIMDSAFVFIV